MQLQKTNDTSLITSVSILLSSNVKIYLRLVLSVVAWALPLAINHVEQYHSGSVGELFAPVAAPHVTPDKSTTRPPSLVCGETGVGVFLFGMEIRKIPDFFY